MINSLNERVEKNNRFYDSKIVALQYMKDMFRLHVEELKRILPSLEDTLKKEGLTIISLSPSKTGHTHNEWKDSDYLKVDLVCKPIGGKIRLIKESGAKSHTRMSEKAKALAQSIREGTGLESVIINMYSFKLDPSRPEKRILGDPWIKLISDNKKDEKIHV